MSYGLLLLRVAVGGVFAAHGAQKVFGWFGGPGLRGVTGMVESLGFRPAVFWAWVLALVELGGGLLFAVGFLTPAVALALASDMAMATWLVHWKNGFFNQNRGWEFPFTLAVVTIAVTATGPGRFSLDRAIGWDSDISGVWWAVGVLVAALVAAGITLTIGRHRPKPHTAHA